jgi:uncharacterized protein YndB with AHSA1/START domain
VSDRDVVVVRRHLAHPPEDVFDAWFDPAGLAEWMCAGTGHATIELDARVGGKFRFVMHHSGGATEHTGAYVTIERPRRLVFTWQSVNTDHRVTEVTVDLTPAGGGTDLTLTHRRLPASETGSHRKGWTDIVRKLDEALA